MPSDYLCPRCKRLSPGDVPWCGWHDCPPREHLSFSVLREAFRLGTQSERYSGGGWLKQRWRGLRWAWSELLFRLEIGGIADAE